ncbi:MAG: MFS transporter [Candidatus Hodarchaeales archaeon]|jgi:MFS family permease
MSSKSPIDKVLSPITTVSTAILREGKSIPQKYRNMISIGLYGFSNAVIVSLVLLFFQKYMIIRLEMDGTLAASIFSYSIATGSIGLLLAVIVGGAYSDDFRSKYGARAPFIVGGSLLAGGMLILVPISATIFPRNFLIVIFPLIFFFAYIGLGIGSSPTNALLSELFTREQRGWVGLAIAGFTTVGSFAGIVGLQWVADNFNVMSVFPVTGFVTIFIGGTIFFLVEKVNPPFEPIDPTIEDIRNTPKYLITYGGNDFGKMLVVQSLWAFAIAAISLYMVNYLGTADAIAAIGEGNEGIVLIITGIVAASMAIPAGLIIKKIGKVNTAFLGSLIFGIYCFGLAFIELENVFGILLPVAMLGGLGSIFIESVRISLPADLVPEGKEAQFMGINKFASTWTQPIVSIMGAQILVLFAGDHPTAVIFILGGVASILASGVLFLIRYEKLLKDEYENFYKRYVRAKGLIGGHIGEITDGIISKFTG